MNQTLIVNSEYSGARLDVYLTEVLDDWTRSQIKKQIDNKGAYIQGYSAHLQKCLLPLVYHTLLSDSKPVPHTNASCYDNLLPEQDKQSPPYL